MLKPTKTSHAQRIPFKGKRMAYSSSKQRYGNGDFSPVAATPLFASVHRPQHASTIKRNAMMPIRPSQARADPAPNSTTYLTTAAQTQGQQQLHQTFFQYQQHRQLKKLHHTQVLPELQSVTQPQPVAGIISKQFNFANVQKKLENQASLKKNSRIPIQQNEKQHRQQPQHQRLNEISRTFTSLFSNIYEKHLLNQTTFKGPEKQNEIHQHQQAKLSTQYVELMQHSQQYGGMGTGSADFRSNYFKSQQQQQQIPKGAYGPMQGNRGVLVGSGRNQHPIHFLKLPSPPKQSSTPVMTQPKLRLQTKNASYQQDFQFMESHMIAGRRHFLLQSEPPPPSEPLNHVYETIKERPPIVPPLVARPKNIVSAAVPSQLPPLPPPRQVKKQFQAGTVSTRRPPNVTAKNTGDLSGISVESRKLLKKTFPVHPPAYVTPPTTQHSEQQRQQYNPQQRSKADGEQRPNIYQQYVQLEQRYEQQPINPMSTTKNTRLHHLGFTSSIQFNPTTLSVSASDATDVSINMETTTPSFLETAMIPVPVSDISVEQALHQAGLLYSSTSSSSLSSATAMSWNSNNNSTKALGLPIVLEEDTGEFNGVFVVEEDDTAQLQYRHGKIEIRLETAQAMAAAAYYARAAQKLAQSGSTKSRITEMPNTAARNGGFCGALQRAPPALPPGLTRRLANKENYGIGKVKVMLRVSDTNRDTTDPHFMTVDKKKRQVTLTDPTTASSIATVTSQERGPMVAAPKMFAFDNLFTAEDQQFDVCASALSEVIPAVLEGSDGCLLTIGYPSSGQTKTMLGGVSPPSELGAIPCAISWLYKGINERRQKSGSRFSVRVSALGVSAMKPDSSSKDLLAAHATESDDSPGVYLRDDFLGGPTELRAPTAERAALFLDAALAACPMSGLQPAMIFTLHVYQYSLSRKGGVAGGRSRLHLIDLGGCANRNGGLPLSGIGNILLAILSGQRHPPNKDHPLTPLLKDCLAPMTCHVSLMAHVTHLQSHTDALTTIQLASRIHRMRRRKYRFPMPSDKGCSGLPSGLNSGHQSTGGSSAGSGADPSSSELSADTVIYMGPSDDATDGEHPPVYLPSLSSGDNRAVMSKVLKGSGVESQLSTTKTTYTPKKTSPPNAPQSPLISNRTETLKRGPASSPIPQQISQQKPQHSEQQLFSHTHTINNLPHSGSSTIIVANSLRHTDMSIMMCSKGSNVPSPKASPLRRPGVGMSGASANEQVDCSSSPMRKITEEQWIDGPRISRAKVAEARHLLREVNHVKQCETWIDGPKSQSSRSLTAGNLPATTTQVHGYGFMDSHKKTMIRQWVENQTSQVFQTASAASSPTHIHRDQQAQHLRNITFHMSQLKQKSLDATEDLYANSTCHQKQNEQQLNQRQHQHQQKQSIEQVEHTISGGLTSAVSTTNSSAAAEIRGATVTQNGQTADTAALAASQTKDETDLHSTQSLLFHTGYGTVTPAHQLPTTSIFDTERQPLDCDEDQDSGPSEVPPALPLIQPLGSREISHESLHRILSKHVSRESLYQLQQPELNHQEEFTRNSSRQSFNRYSQHSIVMSDCGLQVNEEEIARTMGSEHPLTALSHCDNMSFVSSFNTAGDAFSDCAMGERTRNHFDQLARLREIFTSQLAMAEVTPVFRNACDVGSVYSEPAFRFNTGPGSVCSEPPYKTPSPRQPSRSPSQGSLPSLNGIMQIAGMEQYASLRHPDGASDPNLPKMEKPIFIEHEDISELDEKSALLPPTKRSTIEQDHVLADSNHLSGSGPITIQTQLPLLPLNTSSEAYDSGHDSSTPRTSKHSGISRRAESGYHSVATARDSDESSYMSSLSKERHNRITVPKKKRQEKGLCNWLMNPFTCTYPETEGEISDF